MTGSVIREVTNINDIKSNIEEGTDINNSHVMFMNKHGPIWDEQMFNISNWLTIFRFIK